MNAIREWLYVGKYRETLDERWLQANGIQAVLQLAAAVSLSGFRVLFLPVEDGAPLASTLLRQGVDFVSEQRRLGSKVLIACGAGQSRSVAFAAAVLKEQEGLPLLEALRAVKSHHNETLLHPKLWQSLCTFYGEQIPFRSAFAVMTSKDHTIRPSGSDISCVS